MKRMNTSKKALLLFKKSQGFQNTLKCLCMLKTITQYNLALTRSFNFNCERYLTASYSLEVKTGMPERAEAFVLIPLF